MEQAEVWPGSWTAPRPTPSGRFSPSALGSAPSSWVGWNDNLRVWLTEVDSVNAAMPKHGVADCQVGQVAVAVEWRSDRSGELLALKWEYSNLAFLGGAFRRCCTCTTCTTSTCTACTTTCTTPAPGCTRGMGLKSSMP